MGTVIPELKEVLEGLSEYVNNINKAPQLIFKDGVYKQRNKADIQKTTWNGWEFGYQLEEIGDFLLRKCFMKSPEDWDRIEEETKNDIATTVLEAMMDKQHSLPVFVQTAKDVMCVGQKFQVQFLVETSHCFKSPHSSCFD